MDTSHNPPVRVRRRQGAFGRTINGKAVGRGSRRKNGIRRGQEIVRPGIPGQETNKKADEKTGKKGRKESVFQTATSRQAGKPFRKRMCLIQ
jgi:hypothetical protein